MRYHSKGHARALIAAAFFYLSLFSPSQAQTGDVNTSNPEWLQQGWSNKDRQWMYGFSQGSQIILYSWWMSLERADSSELFRADSLTRFGYLPRPVNKQNPDGLPVGFARDEDARGNWIGMNCTACHTNRVQYAGHVYQVDGAPGYGDFQGFIDGIADSLDTTLADPAKFARFYARVRLYDKTIGESELRAALADEAPKFRKFVTQSTPGTPWGRARTDAFGMIFNRVSSIDLNIDSNSRTPDAPVSFPFLWTTNRQDKVQWNAMVPNSTWYDRLGRNVGQVLGVFGVVPGLHDADSFRRLGMRNSVRTGNLFFDGLLGHTVDKEIGKLAAPRWIGPPVSVTDPVTQRGEAVYDQHCAACHIDARQPALASRWPCPTWATPAPKVPKGIFAVCPIPSDQVGTDPRMVQNIVDYIVHDTGALNGYSPLPGFAPIGSTSTGNDILRPVVAGAILTIEPLPSRAQIDSTGGLALSPGVGTAIHAQLSGTVSDQNFLANGTDEKLKVYKGGPLNGIWATAPYLHNGSVPTLADLLKPVAQRPVTFEVGSHLLDVDNIGFVSAPGTGSFTFDTTKPGNSNAGHLYGTDLSDADKNALLQYLKTL